MKLNFRAPPLPSSHTPFRQRSHPTIIIRTTYSYPITISSRRTCLRPLLSCKSQLEDVRCTPFSLAQAQREFSIDLRRYFYNSVAWNPVLARPRKSSWIRRTDRTCQSSRLKGDSWSAQRFELHLLLPDSVPGETRNHPSNRSSRKRLRNLINSTFIVPLLPTKDPKPIFSQTISTHHTKTTHVFEPEKDYSTSVENK